MHTRASLLADLRRLGLRHAPVMVHAALRKVGPILGGADVLVDVLRELAGTVLAYADWEHSALAYEGHALDELPGFDPARARCIRDHGALPELIRTTPGACRSGNPAASVTALGDDAAYFCADHPLRYGYGEGSPLARLVARRGQVLLLGAPLDTVTLLHHAEHVARLPGKRVLRYRERLAGGWVDIEEFDTSRPVVEGAADDYFAEIVRAFGGGEVGRVGDATSHLLDAAELHAFAVAWLEARY